MLTLDSIIPDSLEIFKRTNITRDDIYPFVPTSSDIKEFFSAGDIVIFNISGEITGHAIFKMGNHLTDNQGKDELMEDLFLETSNIIIGNLLTKLDQKFDLLCHLSSPLKISNVGPTNQQMKIMRIISILTKTISDFDTYKMQYSLNHNGESFPFEMLLFMHFNDRISDN